MVRSRLMKRLDEASQFALTLVSAPAGFGKTTLLANWTRQANQNCAWLTLEPGDNDTQRYYSYLISTLERVQPGLLESTRSYLQDEPIQPETLLTALLNKLVGFKEDLFLILDDYHTIENLEIHNSMMFFLDHLPPGVHVILATRSDLPLKLSRMRGRGQMGEIRTGELRFTYAECIEFLNERVGLALSAGQIEALERRTEGWAAGLYLVTLSMQRLDRGQEAEFIASLSSSNHYVLDYLTDEVLSRLNEDLHTFLLETSILERLSAPLCKAVTGKRDSDRLLAQLERENIFLFSQDDDHQWYRYHPLFADLLRKRLVSHNPETLARLYLRASKWMEANDMLSEAVEYALAGGELDQAGMLIERNILELLFRGEFATARGWLEKLPDQMVQSHPLFQLAWAWTHILPGEWNQAEKQLKQIQDRLGRMEKDQDLVSGGQPLRRASLASYLLALQALIARGRGDPTQNQLELVQRALSLAPEDDLRLRAMLEQRLGTCYLDFGAEEEARRAFRNAEQIGWATKSIVNAIQAVYTQAVILRRGGHLREAAEICQQGIRTAERLPGQPGSQVPMTNILQIMWCTVLIERNELEEAEELLKESLNRLEPISQYWEVELQVKGYYALARLNINRGVDLAIPSLTRLAALAKPILFIYAGALQARLELIKAQGDRVHSSLPGEVVRWATGVILREPDEPPVDWLIFEQLVCMRVHAVLHTSGRGGSELGIDLERDLAVLEQYVQQVDSCGWVDLGIETRLAGAQLLIALRRDEAAMEKLRQALELGEPRGYLRIYLDEGVTIIPYLYRLAAAGFLPGYTGRLLTIAEEAVEAHPDRRDMHIERLTAREIEVLNTMASGLSNQEIGRQLFISIGTVKRHTANINRKLDVHSRFQAVARARALGILDRPGG